MKDAWSKHVVHKTQLYELAVSHILAHDPFLQRRAFTEFLPLWIQFYTFHICPSSKILHCSWKDLLDITFLKFIATLGIHKNEKRKKEKRIWTITIGSFKQYELIITQLPSSDLTLMRRLL
jgi:hypothetical protein